MVDDPDNPPLNPDFVWVPWKPRFRQKVARHRARWLARQADDLTFENEINYRFGHGPAYERQIRNSLRIIDRSAELLKKLADR